MGDGDRLPADGADRVSNEAANVNGAVVQVGSVEGDVTVHVARDLLEVHDVPVIVTVGQSETDALVRFQQDEPDVVRDWSSGLTVLVEGRSAQAVVLTALRLVMLARRPPRPVVVVRVCGRFSEALERRLFTVDLERDPPRLMSKGPDFPFTVTASDPEQFRIDLKVLDHEVDWHLELDWICTGRAATVRIPTTGHYTHYPIQSWREVSEVLASSVVRALRYDQDRPVRVGQVRVDPRGHDRRQVMALRATFADVGEVDVPIVPNALRLHAYPAGDAIEPADQPLATIQLDESVYHDDSGWGAVSAIVKALHTHLG